MTDDGTKKYWTDLRTITTQLAESGVPATSGFVTVDWGGSLPDEIEIRFDSISTTGSPTYVYFNVWRLLNDKVDRLYRAQYDSTELTAPIPVNLKFDAEQIYVTVDFSGGTTPRASTLCQYRIIK